MSNGKFKNKYRIAPARLANWDYGSSGLYFVTICTKDRKYYFGDIVQAQNIAPPPNDKKNPDNVQTQYFAPQNNEIEPDNVQTQNMASPDNRNNPPNPETQNAFQETQNIASLRATAIGTIAIENWISIPEHFPFIELDEFVVMPNHVHGILCINKPDKHDWQPNKFGVQSQNIASVLRGYKASVKTYATTNQIEFGWQARYHDHVIRDEFELIRIRYYISNNPAKWLIDKRNLSN